MFWVVVRWMIVCFDADVSLIAGLLLFGCFVFGLVACFVVVCLLLTWRLLFVDFFYIVGC